MKNMLIALIIILIYGTMVETYAMEHETNDTLPMSHIADAMEKQSLEMDEWKVMLKESFPSGELKLWKKQAEIALPDGEWTNTEDSTSKKFIRQNHHKDNGMSETFSIIVPKDASLSAEAIYTLDGVKWNADAEKFVSTTIQTKKSRIFSENVAIFSCMKTSIDGTIDDVLVYQNLEDLLNIETIEHISENDFTSISGYTELWEESIPLLDRPMNIQFGVREGLGTGTIITIGTPIITAEY
ncbi:YwmB family TATA-box binding protein [Thalassobacillus hwangdonensis]|uniref:YwmB family TATA-box binding protein n=1 Tax=Thalassobacillus hwangdonensis TaxID=546108 RepID=A0ABW3L4I5_9BACI